MDINSTIGLGQSPQPEVRVSAVTRNKPEPQVPAQQHKAESTPQQLLQAVQTINRKLANSTSLMFSIDEGTNTTIVRVVDKDTGELIRQIPSEAALAIASSIGEFQKGLLLKQEA